MRPPILLGEQPSHRFGTVPLINAVEFELWQIKDLLQEIEMPAETEIVFHKLGMLVGAVTDLRERLR